MTAREQRTIRWGVSAAAVILLYVVAIDPYLNARSETSSLIEQRESQLEHLLELQRSLPVYQHRLATAQATWDTEVVPRLIASDIPNIAASALSEDVRRIAAQSFLEVERENVLPPDEQDGLTSIPVQFSLRGDIYGLRDFLAAVETSNSFLNLRELRVTTTTGGFGQPAGNAAPLQITATVEGYLGGGPGTQIGKEAGIAGAGMGAAEGVAGGGAAAGAPGGAPTAAPAGAGVPTAAPAGAGAPAGAPAGVGAAANGQAAGVGATAPPTVLPGPVFPRGAAPVNPGAQNPSGAQNPTGAPARSMPPRAQGPAGFGASVPRTAPSPGSVGGNRQTGMGTGAASPADTSPDAQ